MFQDQYFWNHGYYTQPEIKCCTKKSVHKNEATLCKKLVGLRENGLGAGFVSYKNKDNILINSMNYNHENIPHSNKNGQVNLKIRRNISLDIPVTPHHNSTATMVLSD